jgi:hypothetical protein
MGINVNFVGCFRSLFAIIIKKDSPKIIKKAIKQPFSTFCFPDIISLVRLDK